MHAKTHAGNRKKTITVRATTAIAILILLAAGAAAGAQAQSADPMAARLSADKTADIETGSFSAGDRIAFSLEPLGNRFVLRLSGTPELFVLEMERVTLGGRVLKYDTGATALKVSIWGGITLYTEEAPGGLPATRTGDFTAPPHPAVSEAELSAALRDESSHLSYARKVSVHFTGASGNDDSRAQAFDALANTDAGIDRVVASGAGRAAFTRRIENVKLVEGDRPGVALSGKTLVVSFVPGLGAAGRPSSRAIAVALGKFLAVPEAG